MPSGFVEGKFEVRHHRRGLLRDREAFVLVPARDPAAAAALRTYAAACPDRRLADEVSRWVGEPPPEPRPSLQDLLRVWVPTLAVAVRDGEMDVATALRRIAGHAWERGRRAAGGAPLPGELV